MLAPVCGNVPHPSGGLLKVVSAQVPGADSISLDHQMPGMAGAYLAVMAELW